MANDRRRSEEAGRTAETIALWYLRLKGWRVLASRVKTPRGEVDLIVRRGRTVAFVEVKWRERAADLDTAIDAHRLRRVAAAAEALAHKYARPGDVQRIDRIDSRFDQETFKHILLPVWTAAYKYGDKSYRFLVNGQTGEVEGERPWSAWKIGLAVLGVAAVVLGAIYLKDPGLLGLPRPSWMN